MAGLRLRGDVEPFGGRDDALLRVVARGGDGLPALRGAGGRQDHHNPRNRHAWLHQRHLRRCDRRLYASASENPTTLLADNHRTARCVWGKAIRTRAELAAVTNDLTGVYGLGADIDLAGENWTPIGHGENTAFAGTIYGQGHAISNMVVDTEGNSCAGLFGYIDHATITDLKLVNPVVGGANCVGALAGYATGATISGCTVEGADVEATSERAGCFAGQIEGGSSISRCSATGSIAGSDRYVGGFVGSAAGSTVLEKCFALAEVSGAGEGTGGFVGYAEGSPSFSECFACGSVDSTGTSAGGFAGYLSGSPAVSDCYALADVKGGNYVGGFAGHFYYCDGAFERCYAAGTETSTGEAGGFVGRQYRGSPSFADCFRIAGGRGDVGAEDVAGIDALDAAGMRSTDNFAAFLETEKWTQADGLTQPYFAWSLVDGKMTLGGKPAGTGRGSIEGVGVYAPGETVTLVAAPEAALLRRECLCGELCFQSIPALPAGDSLRAVVKIRSHHAGAPAVVEARGDGTALLRFDAPVRAPAPGQSAVFYDAARCVIGAGVLLPEA